jgi:hypothetical protein
MKSTQIFELQSDVKYYIILVANINTNNNVCVQTQAFFFFSILWFQDFDPKFQTFLATSVVFTLFYFILKFHFFQFFRSPHGGELHKFNHLKKTLIKTFMMVIKTCLKVFHVTSM